MISRYVCKHLSRYVCKHLSRLKYMFKFQLSYYFMIYYVTIELTQYLIMFVAQKVACSLVRIRQSRFFFNISICKIELLYK